MMGGVEASCNREGPAPTVSWLHVPGQFITQPPLCLYSDQSDRCFEHDDP